MRDYSYNKSSIGEQILNGVFIAFWLIFWPFKQIFRFIRWFGAEVAKEIGVKMVKYVSGIIFLGLISLITYYFSK